MFDQLFKRPSAIARRANAPYAEERQRYLAACAQQGNCRSTLLFDARDPEGTVMTGSSRENYVVLNRGPPQPGDAI